MRFLRVHAPTRKPMLNRLKKVDFGVLTWPVIRVPFASLLSIPA